MEREVRTFCRVCEPSCGLVDKHDLRIVEERLREGDTLLEALRKVADWAGEDLFEAEVGGVRYHRDFVFERIGHNLESVEILAAFGLVQLGKLETFAAARRARFAEHAAFFATRAEHFLLPRQLPELETTWMQYPLVVRDEAPFDREAMHRYLEQGGVIARPIWTGNILRHPGFEKIECRTTNEGYPVSDEVLRGGLLIAAHHGMLDAHVAQIHQVVDAFLAQY
jgi:CDP-6-deoxy-D-xylo-4-hexulose-3-dehydrase